MKINEAQWNYLKLTNWNENELKKLKRNQNNLSYTKTGELKENKGKQLKLNENSETIRN
jgi:hypothetical protein